MSAIRKLASQTAIYGLSSIIGRLAVWGLTPIYTSRLGLDEYGIFSDLYSFVTYFLVILTFGMETSFFRFSSDNRKDFRPYAQSFIFVTALSLIFLFLFGVGHQGFASVLGYSDRSSLVLMVVLIIFLDVIAAMPMAKLRYDERPMVFAFISLLSIFINIGLNIFFIVIQGQTEAEYIFISNLVASIIKVFLLFFFSLPISNFVKKLGRFGAKLGSINILPERFLINKKMMRSMVNFGLFIMLAGLFGMINQYSDVNFIRRVWGDEPRDFGLLTLNGKEMAGIFAANKKLAVFILLVTQAFRYAAEPFFFRQAKEKDSRRTFARVFHYFIIAALAMFLLVSSFSYEFVSIKIAGVYIIAEPYWIGLDVVPLLLFSFVLWGAYINISIWFKLTKQVRFGIFFSGVGVIIVVLLNFILIPFMGYTGAAIAMTACYSVMTFLVYYTGQKYYPIPYNIPRIALYALIFIAAFFLNDGLGQGKLFSGIFFQKLGICTLTLGLIFAMEKFMPPKWKQVQSGANGSKKTTETSGKSSRPDKNSTATNTLNKPETEPGEENNTSTEEGIDPDQ